MNKIQKKIHKNFEFIFKIKLVLLDLRKITVKLIQLFKFFVYIQEIN